MSKISKIIKQRIENQEIQTWLSEIHDDSGRKCSQKNKLRTYINFKKDYKQEEYPTEVKNIKHRISMTKLRISNHCLEIEKEDIHDPTQNLKLGSVKYVKVDVENELHFILDCPFYVIEREKLRIGINKQTNFTI